jgi:hypothetical protein
METSMPFKPSSLLLALALSLGTMLASADPAAKAHSAAAKSAAPASGAASPAAPVKDTAAPAVAGEATESTVVYLAKSGSRYHLKGCKYLKGAGKEITVGEAMRKGLAPCNVCKAPRLKR